MRQNMIHALVVAGFFLIGAGCKEKSAVTLVADGKPKAVIVIPAQSNLAPAAKMLADHIRQASGAQLAVINENALGAWKVANGILQAPSNEFFILLGESEPAKQLKITGEGLGSDGIRICAAGNVLVLLSPNAVPVFLEQALGCRYLWPGELGKVVPKQTTIAVPPMDKRFVPLVSQRFIRWMGYSPRVQIGLDNLRVSKAEWETWRSAGMATASSDLGWLNWHCASRTQVIPSGHAFMDTWQKWGKDHPDWFALQPDGTRIQKSSRPRLCKSNPDLANAIAADIIERVNKDPSITGVSLGPNDGGRDAFCMCEACKALDPPEGRKIEKLGGWDIPCVSLTDRMVFFWNAIAEKVTRVHPKLTFAVDASSVYSAPPVRLTLHPNLIVRFASISYGSEEARQQGLRDWDGWTAKASKIFWRPNLLGYGKRTGQPANYARKLAQDVRHLAQRGMHATDFDCIMDNWAGQGLNYYILAKALWDPDIDVDAVIDDYCRAGFGPAADHIKNYFLELEKVTGIGDCTVFTPEVCGRLSAHLDAADKAADNDDIIRRRIVFLRRGFEIAELQGQIYPLLEKCKSKDTPPAEAKQAQDEMNRLLERKFLLMWDIIQNDTLAVNVAYMCFGEWGNFGWTPDTTVLIKATDANPKTAP